MKLYKIPGAPAGERFHSAKTGLKDFEEIELPKDGRARHGSVPQQQRAGACRHRPAATPGARRAREGRAARSCASGAPTTVPDHERDWTATDIQDFVLNRATVAQAESIFSALGTRFKELVNDRR
jgi:hypothetical protein